NHAALLHGKEEVNSSYCARAMCNHDGNAAARTNRKNGLRQRGVAFRIEIGVGLVEYHQEWIAIERARKRNALPLPRRKGDSAFPDGRVVSALKGDNHLVYAGGPGRPADRLRIRIGFKSGNILGYRASEQLHMLREVADVASW